MAAHRKTSGLDLLRRVMGLAIGRNISASFTPAQCLEIIKELEQKAPRKGRIKSVFIKNPPDNLRE